MNLVNKLNLVIILRLIIAATFLLSAYSKVINPGSVEVILIDQGIVNDRITTAYIIRLFIGLEFAIGILFLLPYYLKSITIPLTLLLLIFFSGYLGYSGFILGDKENCGCFGEVLKMSPVESILKNIALIILVLILFVKANDNRKKIYLTIVVLPLAFATVFAISPIRDVSEFKFSKFIYFEGAGRVDLTSGDKLVAVFSLDCDHCQQTATEIAELQRNDYNLPDLYVLFFSEGNVTVDLFNSITHSNFSYHMIDANDFFNLIGNQPPRIYWLKNGKVEKYWDDKVGENLRLVFNR